MASIRQATILDILSIAELNKECLPIYYDYFQHLSFIISYVDLYKLTNSSISWSVYFSLATFNNDLTSLPTLIGFLPCVQSLTHLSS